MTDEENIVLRVRVQRLRNDINSVLNSIARGQTYRAFADLDKINDELWNWCDELDDEN